MQLNAGLSAASARSSCHAWQPRCDISSSWLEFIIDGTCRAIASIRMCWSRMHRHDEMSLAADHAISMLLMRGRCVACVSLQGNILKADCGACAQHAPSQLRVALIECIMYR